MRTQRGDESRDESLDAISLLDEPVRRRLYDWVVAEARPVGREEAARVLEISRSLATFHLDRLADGGLLATGYRRLTGRVGPGAGRPARVYWRAEREFNVSLPERRYEIAARLFATALERLSGGAVPPPLHDAARDVGESLGRGSGQRAPGKRLQAALEQGGYEPHVEPDGTVRFRNCPFHALAEAHRQVMCGTNLALAEGIVRGTGATNVQPVLDPQPGYCCVALVPGADTDAAASRRDPTSSSGG